MFKLQFSLKFLLLLLFLWAVLLAVGQIWGLLISVIAGVCCVLLYCLVRFVESERKRRKSKWEIIGGILICYSFLAFPTGTLFLLGQSNQTQPYTYFIAFAILSGLLALFAGLVLRLPA